MKIKILYRWKNISVLEMFTHRSRLLCKYQFALGILITVYIRFLAYPVSFSEHILSVVLRCCCCCCHRHKHFTFSSSSPEPLRQFQLNLVQSILGWWGLKFVQMKGPTFFQGEIITKYQKYIDKLYKSSSPEPMGQFQRSLAQCILGWNYKIAKIHLRK